MKKNKALDLLNEINFIKMMKNYKSEFLKQDLLAGLSVAAIALPQNMAYALIIGVNPIYGIYTSIISMVLATLGGVSSYMIVGPTNMMAMAIASSLKFVTGENYLAVLFLLTLLVGVFQLVFGLLNLGNLVNYVSHPVIIGLSTGAALLIGVGQLQNFLGLSLAGGPNLFTNIYKIAVNLDQVNLLTVYLGILTIVTILIIQKINSKLPSYLITLIVITVIVFTFNLENQIEVIGDLPASIPEFNLVSLSVPYLGEIITKSLSIALLGLIQTLAVVKSLAAKTGEEANINKEFIGQGIINIGCSLFSSFAIAGSFAKSFANYQAGAKTRLSEFFVALAIMIFMLLFSPVFKYIPIVALAGLVIVVAVSMIDVEELKQAFQTTKGDALIFISTFIATITAPSIDYAIYFGVLVSVIVVLRESSKVNIKPVHYEEDPKKGELRQTENVDELAEDLEEDKKGEEKDCIVVDLSGNLHFSSVDNLKEELERLLPTGENFVIRMRNIERIDLTIIRELKGFIAKVHKKNGLVKFAGVNKKLYKVLENSGIVDKVGEENIFKIERILLNSTKQALDATYEEKNGEQKEDGSESTEDNNLQDENLQANSKEK
ncbi:SulP family inorganic anion transporter [Halanaerobacter jeridensis]|uniref:SulP family sulfate permease n=1 Tax=Halanaerobacter jeridensis TaxID=706427 RepID=A0A939BNS7_9FIRM|nr:SulP family inorganic anion transporter [Halanaerobacter jeridensis]MBM7555997.1 SulP family sulfate permease [Halanaerobacter jeridensis]